MVTGWIPTLIYMDTWTPVPDVDVGAACSTVTL